MTCPSRTVREAFLKWDADDSGFISKEELAEVLVELSFDAGDAEKLLKDADRDGNGLLDYNEFVTWIMGRSAPLGAAVLLQDSCFNIRADAASPIGAPKPTFRNGPLAWKFGTKSQGSVRVEPPMILDLQYTIACWMKLAAFDAASQNWVPLLGDHLSSWGFLIGLTSAGRIGFLDPRTGSGKLSQEANITPGAWVLLVVRGKCATPTASQRGTTEFLVCSGVDGLRSVGTMSGACSGLVIAELGSKSQGLASLASVSVWQRQLTDLELRRLFLHDAVRLGAITEEEESWMKLNRRTLPQRSEENESMVIERCGAAETGDEEVGGTLDLSYLTLADADLPRILNVVDCTGPGGITTLRLAGNYFTEDGVIAHLVPFLSSRETPIFIDIRDNPDINDGAEEALLRALKTDMGCRLEAKGTQLSDWGVAQLENITEKAATAVRSAANARAVAAFEAQQAGLEDKWKNEVDPPLAREDEGDPELAKAAGVVDGVLEEPKKPMFKKFPKSKEELKMLRTALAYAGRRFCDRREGLAYGWQWEDRLPPPNCGGGQLLAHFSYLSCKMYLRPPEDFGLRIRAQGEAWSSKSKPAGCIGLHSAIEQRLVDVNKAIGKGYGRKALSLQLTNLTDGPVDVAVPPGTIFCDISWVHHQNLLVGRVARFKLEAGESCMQKLDAHCMNMSCGWPAKDPFALTPFLCENPKLLTSQSNVWDYFEGMFSKYKQESLDALKKGKKKPAK